MGRPLDWLVEGLLEDLLIDVESTTGSRCSACRETRHR